MPWTTPTLRTMRERVRDDITSSLSGAAVVGNTVLRVLADVMGGLTHLVLKYIDWLVLQLMPDTAEKEWLDRHGDIWLVNADGSVGRKAASYASGVVTMSGTIDYVVPIYTALESNIGVGYETTEEVTLSSGPTEVSVRALDGGVAGNQEAGAVLSVSVPLAGIDNSAVVVTMTGGADEENDDDLRIRVLERIRNPPMGGSEADWIAWTKDVPGVTRAWAAQEMGIGTVTARFMMDELRADNDGFPLEEDIAAVTTYLDTVRPVAVKDMFVVGPVPQPINFSVTLLETDTAAVRAAVEVSVREMLLERAEPGQTIYRSWIDEAVSQAVGEQYHELTFTTEVMQSPGHMAVLGTIAYL